jgi:DNA-directed RNA polymerase sigma subunit (sigma70/sigma32)
MPGSLETPDELLGQNTSEKAQRIALGIAIAHATCPAGHSRSREEIAAYADVSVEAIRRIEQQALRKVRERVEELLREANVDLREVRL